MELITHSEISLIGIKTLTKRNLGILYDLNVTKTVGDLLEILLNKIKYSYPGVITPSTELFLMDENATQQSALEPSELLTTLSDSLSLGIRGSDKVSDNYKHNYQTIKSQIFDTSDSTEIHFKTVGGKTIVINVDISKATVLDIKYRLEELIGPPACDQRLIFCGHQLEDKNILNSYGVKCASVIHITLRLRGGMLHEVSGRNGYLPLGPITIYDSITDTFVQV